MVIFYNPPTPAFAKAGAAPGTTRGVELGSRVASSGTRHQGNTSVSYMPQPSTCSCRLPGLKPSKLSAGLQGNNSYSYMPLNTSVSYMPQPSTCSCPPSNPPNASNPPAGLQGNNSYSYMPLPSVFQGVQDCRLPALKPPKTPQTLPQASKATTLTATCP